MKDRGTSRESRFSRCPVSAAYQKVIRSGSSRVPMWQYDVSEHFRYSGDIRILTYIYSISRVYTSTSIQSILFSELSVRRAEQALDAVGVVVAFPFLDIPSYEYIDMYFDRTRMVFLDDAPLCARIQLQDLDRNFFLLLVLVVLSLGLYQQDKLYKYFSMLKKMLSSVHVIELQGNLGRF